MWILLNIFLKITIFVLIIKTFWWVYFISIKFVSQLFLLRIMIICKSLSRLFTTFNNMWDKRTSILEYITPSSLSKHDWCWLPSDNPATKLDNSTLNFRKFPICLINWFTLNFTICLVMTKIVFTQTFKLLKRRKVIRLKNHITLPSKQRFTDPINWDLFIFIMKVNLWTILVSR